MKVHLIVACLAAVTALAGCSSSSSTSDHDHVAARDSNFNPSTVNLAVGETLGWINEGKLQHTVTIHSPTGGASLLDKTIDSGVEVEHKFDTAGTFHVVCRFHEASGMVMTVKVA